MSVDSLVVGARGWNHVGWSGVYYPNDLPEEWRLTYYSNEFRGVLIPELNWRRAGDAALLHWADSVTEEFLFFLEYGSSRENEHRVERCRHLLGVYFGGLMRPGIAIMGAEESWDLRCLKDRLELLSKGAERGGTPAFFLDGAPPDIEHLRAAKQLSEMLML